MKEPSKIWNFLKAAVPILIVTLLLIGFGIFYSWKYSSGLYRDRYEGRIVDKSLTFSETQLGSGIRRRLLIEDKNGTRFEVAVKADLYDRAQVGMLIKNGIIENSMSSSR